MPRVPTTPQGRYWLLTIPHHHFTPFLPGNVAMLKGQLECSNETSYLHWQVFACFCKKVRLTAVKSVFGAQCHAELSNSKAAEDYVWKEDTRVEGTQFCLGEKPLNRNSAADWKIIKEKAKSGLLDEVEPDIYIRYYRTLKEIARDHMVRPPDLANVCGVWIWGPPGVGKSQRARDLYENAYLKPCNKWWDGYQNHANVIIDDLDKNHEVLGHHIKIWADRYAFIAETKGGAMTIRPKKIVITSNYCIEDIFVKDAVLAEAIKRRFMIVHCPIRLF